MRQHLHQPLGLVDLDERAGLEIAGRNIATAGLVLDASAYVSGAKLRRWDRDDLDRRELRSAAQARRAAARADMAGRRRVRHELHSVRHDLHPAPTLADVERSITGRVFLEQHGNVGVQTLAILALTAGVFASALAGLMLLAIVALAAEMLFAAVLVTR